MDASHQDFGYRRAFPYIDVTVVILLFEPLWLSGYTFV